MEFYRQATEEDFENAIEKFENNMPPSVSEAVRSSMAVDGKTIKEHREIMYVSLQDARSYQTRYLNTLQAYKDHTEGKVVFVCYDDVRVVHDTVYGKYNTHRNRDSHYRG